MINNAVSLEVMGISRKAYEHNAYALLLRQRGGEERVLPVVVGMSEAQAIAVSLESVVLPRPITHDLFTTIFHAFGIAPESVEIYDFADGVFYSRLRLLQGEMRLDLDCRTSDAVAIALRTGAPIYTTHELLDRAGYLADSGGVPMRDTAEPPLEAYSLERLRLLLQQAVEAEEYERAAEIQKIIASKMA